MKKLFISISFLFRSLAMPLVRPRAMPLVRPLVVLLIGAFFAVALPITASAEYYEIDNLSVAIDVKKDGSIDVEERFDIRFTSPRHGIFRFIPLKVKDDNGKTLSLSIYNIDVKRNGEKTRFITSYEDGNIFIKIGHRQKYVNGKQTYTIKYSASCAFKFAKEKDIFMWNITGNNHPVNIYNTSFFIRFPKDVFINDPNTNNPRIFVGPIGSQDRYESFYVTNNELMFLYPNTLLPHTGISIFIDFDKGIFKEKTLPEKLLSFIKRFSGELTLLFSFIFVLLLVWYIYGKDDYVPVAVRYYPPDNMSPVMFRYILSDYLNSFGASSIIFYWASKGYLKISQDKNNDEIYLIKLRDIDKDKEKDYEQKVFNALFKNSDKVGLKELQSLYAGSLSADREGLNLGNGYGDFRTEFRKLYSYVLDDAKKMGVYTESSKNLMLKVMLLSVFVCLPIFVLIMLKIIGLSYFLVILVIMVFSSLFSIYMYKKTPYGNRLYAQAKGFEEFLKKVENPQIETLMRDEIDYCNKILPYAIAIGIENKFIKKMQSLLVALPSCYEGVDGYKSFNKVVKTSVRSFSYSYSSPSNGGSSGGGSSGGGCGGGGSGSW